MYGSNGHHAIIALSTSQMIPIGQSEDGTEQRVHCQCHYVKGVRFFSNKCHCSVTTDFRALFGSNAGSSSPEFLRIQQTKGQKGRCRGSTLLHHRCYTVAT